MTLRPEKNLHIHKYVCLGLKQLFSPIYYWQCARDRAKMTFRPEKDLHIHENV